MTQTIKRAGDNPGLESLIPTPAAPRAYLSYWTSPEALASHVATLGDGAGNWERSAWGPSASFLGCSTMSEAIELCRNGWPEGAARAASLRDRINAANPMGPRVVKWDVAGSLCSVPRALAGNPLNMRRVDTTRLRRKPVLTLLSDVSCSWTVNATAITNRAAVVAAVIDAAEGAGFACEVVTFNHTKENDISQVTAVTAKEAGAPADIGRLAFALGHAAFKRRLTWAAFTCDVFTKRLTANLGMPTKLNQSAANELGAYIVPSAGANEAAFATEDSAATKGLAFLISSLRAQNCPAFPKDENEDAA